MTFDLAISCAAIVALLVASAFFSGSETALTAVSKARMHALANDGSQRARRVSDLIVNRERLIGALLLGNNFVNILASALATSVMLSLFGDAGVALATLAMTAVILVFAEVLPKTFAITRTDRMALAIAPAVSLITALLAPIVGTVQFIVWRVLWLFGVREDTSIPVLSAHEEIRGAIHLHHLEGTVEREHRNMLGGILDLRELEVGDVMVHRKSMEMIDADAPAADIMEQVLSSVHTRFPLWRKEPDNIVGTLHAKDLLHELSKRRGSIAGLDISTIAAKPWFVPETTSLEDQLRAFRERRTHFALVVDEYGALQGLVTLEDILEEIFGDIADEHDLVPAAGIRPQADGSYNVDGWTPIREINRALDWNLPDEDATTIAGLVIHEARTIPDVGQVFAFHGFKFEVLRRQRNQIMAVRITPLLRTPAVSA